MLSPNFLRWMPGAKDIIRYDKYKEFADKLIAEADVICCLDFNALSRIDAMADAVAASKGRKMMVDHHLYPGDFLPDCHFSSRKSPPLPNSYSV